MIEKCDYVTWGDIIDLEESRRVYYNDIREYGYYISVL